MEVDAAETFGESLKLAAREGLVEVKRQTIPGTIAALLEKRAGTAAKKPTARKPAAKKPAAKKPATRRPAKKRR